MYQFTTFVFFFSILLKKEFITIYFTNFSSEFISKETIKMHQSGF